MRAWKRTILILPILLGLACATGIPNPTQETAVRASRLWPGADLASLKTGRDHYIQNCGACHALHLPNELTPAQWDRIMVRMQVKARIDDNMSESILHYVKSFAAPE